MTDKYKPGRELDLLIAEKVMGISVLGGSIINDEDERDSPQCYSTDIYAAWEIVEKMKETNDLIVYALRHDDYVCEINKEGSDVRLAQIIAKSAPHAICLASLKCKGVEI